MSPSPARLEGFYFVFKDLPPPLDAGYLESGALSWTSLDLLGWLQVGIWKGLNN